MSKQKSQQATRPSSAATAGLPFWAWLLAGIVIGAALSGLTIYQRWVPLLRPSDQPQANPQAQPAQSQEPALADEASKPAEKPKYDFYSVLPEMETVIPETEIQAQAQAQPADARTQAATERLFLQAGSFQSQGEAEQMKARLALSGERAQITSVNVNGRDWFRVRVGPYANARELEQAKQALGASGINAIALREKS